MLSFSPALQTRFDHVYSWIWHHFFGPFSTWNTFFWTHESKIGREEKFRYMFSFWTGLVHCTTNNQHDHFITHCSICHYDTATLRMPISSIATTNSPLRKYDFIAIDFFLSFRKVNFLTLTQQCLRRACLFPGLNRITGPTVC